MQFHGKARLLRAALFASAAAAAVIIGAQPALAGEGTADPDPTGTALNRDEAVLAPQTSGLTKVEAELDPQIVIGYPGTATTARDPVNITGVAQMITDQGGGFIGLCTGTLINPRTVILAAHCVNGQAANSYGANSGGTAIGFGFETYTRANAAGQTDELVRWLLGGTGGAGKFQTNTAQAFYNANAVAYHPGSLEPDANSFLYSDVALASLDTPAEGIPTWALLFSKLPAPATSGAGGTGYHVTITGYGNNGTGTSGSGASVDYRRRVAENMLGALASLDDFEGFIFGGGGGLPQNLYWIDFDDPRRTIQGQTADSRDFNAWRDNPLPNEGITASGDSGGPLILDNTFARKVVIGVLSGGYTRFFNGAPANGYGTTSFYQPLYLYWDWIAANNPYRYVTNVAGNRKWSDGANWVTTVDPNYTIIGPNGQLVNGVPTSPGEGVNGTSGKFGEACIEGPVNGGFSDCYNFATDTYTGTVRPIGTDGGDTVNNAGVASVDSLTGGLNNDRGTALVDAALEAQATGDAISGQAVTGQALPAATIANGLPGATNFVPNNSDGNRTQGVLPRYFDVTLSAAGTTTLDTVVTVDKFTLAGAQAGLTITSTGSLTSLMDVTQVIGTMHVDGTLRAPSDFLITAGGLSGSGNIISPFTTSVAGVIAPGTATTIGTLTFQGNLILASGSAYLLNLGASGASDRIAVRATTFSGTTPTNGIADLGGTIAISWSPDTMRRGNTYTILTAEGGLTANRFVAPAALSAILTPRLTYTANAVQLTIDASSYTSVIDTSSPIQSLYATLLERNRNNPALLGSLYAALDVMDGPTVRSQLLALSPAAFATMTSIGVSSAEDVASLADDRLAKTRNGSAGGTFARYGQPLQLAANSFSANSFGASPVMSDSAPQVVENALPENLSAFVAGGYLEGNSAPLTGAPGIGRDTFNGWHAAAGIESLIGDRGVAGFTVSYSRREALGAMAGQSATSNLYHGMLYGSLDAGSVTVDAKLGAGLLEGKTKRSLTFGGTPYTLRSDGGSLVVNGELGVSGNVALSTVALTPRLAVRGAHIDFSRVAETGGPVALVYDQGGVDSVQGRAGLTLGVREGMIQPFIGGTLVHEFVDQQRGIDVDFVGGTGGAVTFGLPGSDKNWGEIGGGLKIVGSMVDVSVEFESTVGRQDLEWRRYKGTVSVRF